MTWIILACQALVLWVGIHFFLTVYNIGRSMQWLMFFVFSYAIALSFFVISSLK